MPGLWPVLLVVLAATVALPVLPTGSAAPRAAAQATAGDEVIVVLADGADPKAVAAEMGVTPTHIYRHVFTGFAGTLPAEAAAAARSSRLAVGIFPDEEVQIEGQKIPTGVRRAGVPHEPGAKRLQIDSPIDADIAIIDTGVSRHPDLNVVDGKSCVVKKNDEKKGKPWEDEYGHGTHVAGTAAAKDNGKGVAGVAPGARIWSVKVFDASGRGPISDVICGLDWVAKKSDRIDVANMSLSASGGEGSCNHTALHKAVCKVVEKGVVVVVAAGNQGRSAGIRVPASYDEVITVSAFADTDGKPGGNGPLRCGSIDDRFLSYSNYGPDVDIMAPGACILSLQHDGKPKKSSGTSSAAPHVSGAAAHFIAREKKATGKRPSPEETRQWLLTEASRSQQQDGVTGDHDNHPEPVLWLEILEEVD
jgi:hypothetical protein